MSAREVMSVDEWLREQGIALARASLGGHKTTCPQCSATRRNQKDPCLSVTIRPGDDVVAHCHHCGWAAGNRPPEPGPAPRPRRRSYTRPKPEPEPRRPDTLYNWFEARAISRETVEAAGVYKTRQWFPQTRTQEECIAFPYRWDGALRNVKYRTAAKHFRQEKNPEPVLYNADAIEAGEDLIFVEGEIDALSFIEAGFTHVVSLPNGAPAEAGETSDRRYEPLATHAEQLERVRRVLIATDMDAPGEALAGELARRLGKDRCFRVRFDLANDETCKDANEALIAGGAEALRQCVEAAEPWPIDGVYRVADYIDEVIDLYEGRGPQPVSTGFVELDKAFKVIPGQFVVITGVPNHGKTRFIDQVAFQMAQGAGWVWAIFSPETGEANHVADLIEIASARPFHPGPSERLTRDELRDAWRWLDERVAFIAVADHTPTIDWILERARALVLRRGINGLIIDPYNEIEAGRPKQMTETEFVSQLISKCKRFSRAHDVAVFMIVHPTKLRPHAPGEPDPVPGLYDLIGSSHWRNKADAGLVVYRDYAAGKTMVFSKKIRRQPVCGTPGSVEFDFDRTARRFEEVPLSYQVLGGGR